jgi:hypothetical protein
VIWTKELVQPDASPELLHLLHHPVEAVRTFGGLRQPDSLGHVSGVWLAALELTLLARGGGGAGAFGSASEGGGGGGGASRTTLLDLFLTEKGSPGVRQRENLIRLGQAAKRRRREQEERRHTRQAQAQARDRDGPGPSQVEL